MNVDFQPGRDVFEHGRLVLADPHLGRPAAGAGLLGVGEVVLDADVREMLEASASRGAGRAGFGRCVGVGRWRRDRLGFWRDGKIEEMPLSGIVHMAFATRAEEAAAEQGQRFEQLDVLLLEFVVVGRGGVEDAFEFVETTADVLGLLVFVFGSLVFVFGSLMFVFGSLMLFLGLLPQRVLAAEQVREEPPALVRIIR